MKKINYIIIAVSVALIIIGFCLMSGGKTVVEYNPEVMAPRRITTAPIICMLGFVGMIFGIMIHPKSKDTSITKE